MPLPSREYRDSPLDIEIVIIAQSIHNDMGTRTTVVDIANDMEWIDRKTLYQIAHGYDKIVGTTGWNDSTDNHIDISMLIGLDSWLVK